MSAATDLGPLGRLLEVRAYVDRKYIEHLKMPRSYECHSAKKRKPTSRR